MIAPAHTVEDVIGVLARFSTVEEPLAGDVPAVLVTHGVQCAEILAAEHPGDPELHLAGLLHDIGLLLVPGDELGHPRHGADFVRPLLGDRTADIIALHVDAQRYLEATVDGYAVTPPPTAPIAEQPAFMTDGEIREFLVKPLSEAALRLRHADDRAIDEQRRGDDLARWRVVMGEVARARHP